MKRITYVFNPVFPSMESILHLATIICHIKGIKNGCPYIVEILTHTTDRQPFTSDFCWGHIFTSSVRTKIQFATFFPATDIWPRWQLSVIRIKYRSRKYIWSSKKNVHGRWRQAIGSWRSTVPLLWQFLQNWPNNGQSIILASFVMFQCTPYGRSQETRLSEW